MTTAKNIAIASGIAATAFCLIKYKDQLSSMFARRHRVQEVPPSSREPSPVAQPDSKETTMVGFMPLRSASMWASDEAKAQAEGVYAS